MKKIILVSAIVAAALLTGCGSSGTSTYNETPDNNKETTVYSGGGDVNIDDVVVGEYGVYINNSDGTVTYTGGDINGDVSANAGSGDSNGDGEPDVEVGVYDPLYTQSECTAAGFFYCTIENKCLDKPAAGSSCTGTGSVSSGSKVK